MFLGSWETLFFNTRNPLEQMVSPLDCFSLLGAYQSSACEVSLTIMNNSIKPPWANPI